MGFWPIIYGPVDRRVLSGAEYAHSGNYLTFAIAYGWVASLVWVYLRKSAMDSYAENQPGQSVMPRAGTPGNSEEMQHFEGVPIKTLAWSQFSTKQPIDYLTLSKSPAFTPAESDVLIPIIEEYIRKL